MSETEMRAAEFDATPYVRDTMLPQAAAPISQVGAVRWMRENLFSSWLNAILTVVALVAVYLFLSAVLPWFLHGVWNASSLTECRQKIAERWGEGATGGCFAVIRERWPQMLYGFYPTDDRFGLTVLRYWRINLAALLLIVALAPALFNRLPKQMLWFTAIYPAVCYFLLWGGTIWDPIFVLAGFGIAYAVFLVMQRFAPALALITAVAAMVLWWLWLMHPLLSEFDRAMPWGLTEVRSSKFGGFTLSMVIGITGITFSLPLGILLALGRKSDMILVKTICVGFIEFIRGVPLITLLFIASLLLNYFLPPGTNFDIILRVIIMVTLFAAAYMAEVVRGGLAALPRGQYEAADALGLDYARAQYLIIMPQALKISIPTIVNTFIGLFKDTTLVVFIGLLDPLGLVGAIRANTEWNGLFWELFLFVGLLFFIVCFGMSRYSMYLERKLKTDHR